MQGFSLSAMVLGSRAVLNRLVQLRLTMVSPALRSMVRSQSPAPLFPHPNNFLMSFKPSRFHNVNQSFALSASPSLLLFHKFAHHCGLTLHVSQNALSHSGWLAALMNAIQCVVGLVVCPYNGGTGDKATTRANGTSLLLHLKIKVPFGFSTRKHSLNPSRSSHSQSPTNRPYLAARMPVVPICRRCGGSNTTCQNDSSGNGMDVKSARISGFTTIGFRPFVPGVPLSAAHSPRLLSMYSPRPSHLSNQNIRLPQHTSRTGGKPTEEYALRLTIVTTSLSSFV